MWRTAFILGLIICVPALTNAQSHGRAKAPAPLGMSEKSAFVQSVRAGDVKNCRLMLARGADPNTESASGAPVLVLAARAGGFALVHLLLDAGARVDADDRNSYSALHHAAQAGDLRLVNLLLARGADVNKLGYDQHTILMFAAHGANWMRLPRPMRDLMQRADAHEGGEGLMPSRFGTPGAYRRVVARLLAAGAEVNVVADCGETALTFATCDLKLTRMLLGAGARVDYGWSPLCLLDDRGQEKLSAANLEEFEGVAGLKRRRALMRSLRRWVAETAPERREVTRLLVAAGATRDNCGDDEDEPKK